MLFRSISLDDLYIVKHWPNLPRLNYIPNATRISAFWIGQAQSINNVVTKLKIPQEDVLTYFSAAHATGLLIPAKRKEDHLSTPEVVKVNEKKQGIFSALFDKISKNIQRNKEFDDEQREVG